MGEAAKPTIRTTLNALTQQRLAMLGRQFGVAVPSDAKKAEQINVLTRPGVTSLPALLRALSRSELKVICKQHALDDSDRSRSALWERLLDAAARYPELVRLDDAFLEAGLWLLMHPELERSARIRVVVDFVIELVREHRAVFEGA